MKKRVVLPLSSLPLIAAILLMGYSFMNPGRFRILDVIRLPIQSRIMASVGDVKVGDYYMPLWLMNEHPGAITMEELEPFLDGLRPGDIFFTDSEGYISSRFIPGKWKHSGIYLGKQEQLKELVLARPDIGRILERYFVTGEERLVLDSSAEGVAVRDISSLSDLHAASLLASILVFRIDKPGDQTGNFLAQALKELGKPYDFDLLLENREQIYCSELIYLALMHIGIELTESELVYGRQVITPDRAARYMLTQDKEEFSMVLYMTHEGGKTVSAGLSEALSGSMP